jgi:hypothetical protein
MSESTYYYADADKNPVGPYSLGRLLGLAAKGVITPTTKVIRKGDKQWVSYSESQPEITQSMPRTLFSAAEKRGGCSTGGSRWGDLPPVVVSVY